jgi:nicotinamide phosphoribosyltransferase
MKLNNLQKLGIAELLTYKRLINELYPTGIVSIVSDTWNFWNVVDPVNGICKHLKEDIMNRDGKVVIRPDSGDPVDIVCGIKINDYSNAENLEDAAEQAFDFEVDFIGGSTPHGKRGNSEVNSLFKFQNNTYLLKGSIEWNRYDKQFYYIESSKLESFEPYSLTVEQKGMIECLWEIFGGTVTSTGYKQLDSHIGAIYGDSITLQRAKEICKRLAEKGFASTNIVLGIGSFTYQGAIEPSAIVTRDTHGFAVKSTYGEVKVEDEIIGLEIFKDPKTDSGLKKSAKGLTAVYEDDGKFVLKDQASWEDVKNCAFVNVFSNGKMQKEWSLKDVRERLVKSF